MKKIFSILLAGVVVFSILGFISPGNYVSAKEETSKGTLTIKHEVKWAGDYKIHFYDSSGNSIGSTIKVSSPKNKNASKKIIKTIKIPQRTNKIEVSVDAYSENNNLLKSDEFKFEAVKNKVSDEDTINIIAKGDFKKPMWGSSCTNGYKLIK